MLHQKKSNIIIKTPEQIDGIRKASKLAAQTLDFVGAMVQPGITTQQLNQAAADFMKQHGAISATLGYSHDNGNPYPAESCVSVNEVVCHGIPGDRVLNNGDIVKIDVTTILEGLFFGDTCRTFPVGKISKKVQDLLDTTEQALNIGIAQVKPGNRIGNIGYHIWKYVEKFGYGIVFDFCGHGCGNFFHEEPSIPHIAPKNTGDIMVPGMSFTIEPMLTIGQPYVVIGEDHWTVSTQDKKWSAQFEHLVLVTNSGHEILTLS